MINKKSLSFREALTLHHRGLLGHIFFDSEFTTVVPTLGAYMVIHYLCAAIAACSQLRFLQRVVRSSLGRSGL